MDKINKPETAASFKATPEHPEKKPGITRRNFLRAVFLGTTAIALKGSLDLLDFTPTPPQATPEPVSEPTPTPTPNLTAEPTPEPIPTDEVDPALQEERFEKLGMREFWSFYTTVTEVNTRLGARNEANFFHRIFITCQKIAEGSITNPDDPEVVRLRDGWGEKKDTVVNDALEYIQTMKVQYDGSGDDPKKFRTEHLPTFAKTFAPMALALPHQIWITSVGTQVTADYLATVTFEDDWGVEEAWSRFFHEVVHATDVWSDRIQPYVSKEDYLEYAATYFKLTQDLILDWLDAPDLETARHFWDGFIRSWGGGNYDNEQNKPIIANLEKVLFNQEFPDESTLYRFIRVLWTAGKSVQNIQAKQQNNEPLTNEEKNLQESADFKLLMTVAIQETTHFLVTPPEGLFFSETSVDESPGNKARTAMNLVRVETFGTFKPNPDQDIGLQIRAQLGIE